jgi:hypothetical protein
MPQASAFSTRRGPRRHKPTAHGLTAQIVTRKAVGEDVALLDESANNAKTTVDAPACHASLFLQAKAVGKGAAGRDSVSKPVGSHAIMAPHRSASMTTGEQTRTRRRARMRMKNTRGMTYSPA